MFNAHIRARLFYYLKLSGAIKGKYDKDIGVLSKRFFSVNFSCKQTHLQTYYLGGTLYNSPSTVSPKHLCNFRTCSPYLSADRINTVLCSGRSDYSTNSHPDKNCHGKNLHKVDETQPNVINTDFKNSELSENDRIEKLSAESIESFDQQKNSNSQKNDQSNNFYNTFNDDYQYDYRVAEDIEEYEYKDEREISQQLIRPEKVLPISLNRLYLTGGQTGVFDLDELLVFLKHLGAEDIVTIPIPFEANFCDHMIVASAKSKRHLAAINDELLWVHKRKKSPEDMHLVIEGLGKSDWSAMDFGNIVLHVFYGEARQHYDIESLWTLGPENDPKCKEQIDDLSAMSAESLFWLEASKKSEGRLGEAEAGRNETKS